MGKILSRFRKEQKNGDCDITNEENGHDKKGGKDSGKRAGVKRGDSTISQDIPSITFDLAPDRVDSEEELSTVEERASREQEEQNDDEKNPTKRDGEPEEVTKKRDGDPEEETKRRDGEQEEETKRKDGEPEEKTKQRDEEPVEETKRSDGEPVEKNKRRDREPEDETKQTGSEERDERMTDTSTDRSSRFGEVSGPDSSDAIDLFRSKNLNELRPFYGGQLVDERMAIIRNTIVSIRKNWARYEDFINDLRTFLTTKKYLDQTDAELTKRTNSMLDTKRDWDNPQQDTFDAIKLYSSVKGYKKIFGVVNGIFREDSSTSSENLIQNAVFLVELINIDLYNFCLKNKQFDNFQGKLYRGMAVKEDELETFVKLREQSIPNRYIAVPLYLNSATKAIGVAHDFVAGRLRQNRDLMPLILRIHVIELRPDLLDYYRIKYPQVVVSTICAVDIETQSDFPGEKEVLLRGAFFQVLDIHPGEEIGGKTSQVMELVMLNTNRDHVCTGSLGDIDAPARALFGTMVAVTRNEFAVEYCKKNGLEEDADKYKELLSESQDKLQKLMED